MNTLAHLPGGVLKGYLRVLSFNEDSVLVDQRTVQLSAAALGNYETLQTGPLVAQQNGYVSVYVGNESAADVYFDDLTIEHRQGLQVQKNQYDPFGLDLAGVSGAAPGLRLKNFYQFNGKENQLDLGLNWSDYGARMYNVQIGRWGVIDTKADLLEMSSPYVYSLNDPTSFIDKDGELPIYINGRVSGGDHERANAAYWDQQLITTIASSGIPNPGGSAIFVDGDQFMFQDTRGLFDRQVQNAGYTTGNDPFDRKQAGYDVGKKDFKLILSNLARDPKTHKITEKVQIYTHSRGAAFGEGYTDALLELIKANASEFQDYANEIEFSLNLAPNGVTMGIGSPAQHTFAMHHDEDLFSGNGMKNAVGDFSSSTGLKTIASHSSSSFVKEVGAFIKSWQANKGDDKKTTRDFVDRMKKLGIKVSVH